MKTILIALIFCTGTANILAQSDARSKQFNLQDGIAVQGYDPVAYFTQHKAVKGKKDFALSKDGITYYFSNASNKELFGKNSANYEPQYGGWCAYAMGETGEKVEIDPETFKILDGKLYVFYNSLFNNTLPNGTKMKPTSRPGLTRTGKPSLNERIMKSKKIVSMILRLVAAAILLQTLYFKFTGQPESVYIFSKIGIEPWGRVGSGIAELVASILLLLPATITIGAAMQRE